MIRKVCIVCGKDFKVKNQRKKTAKFCSIGCKAKWQNGSNNPAWKGGARIMICKNCGKEFELSRNRNPKKRGKFCSVKCMGEYQKGINHPYWKGGKIIKRCIICGKEFKIYPYAYKRRRTCSHHCQGIANILLMPKKETKIEKAVENNILELKLGYQKQVPLCNCTIADFYLPSYKLAIFADGKYWHSIPKVKGLNIFQNKTLKNNGLKVLRITEDDCYRPEIVKERIITYIQAPMRLYKPQILTG